VGQRSGDVQIKRENLITLSTPVCLCGFEKGLACDHASALVIYAEKRRIRVWNLDGYKRDFRFLKKMRQPGSNALIRLKLDCQINALVDQLLRTAERRFDAVAILYLYEVDWPCGRSPAQSLYKRAAKRIVCLRSISYAEAPATHDTDIGGIFSSVTAAEQAFVRQRSQQPETDGPFQARALHDISQ
jgi:hypothetical protein